MEDQTTSLWYYLNILQSRHHYQMGKMLTAVIWETDMCNVISIISYLTCGLF